MLGVDGVSDFNALHSRKHDHEVQLYAFDCLALAGDDLRALPLHMRKANLAQLLLRRPEGIFVAPFELKAMLSILSPALGSVCYRKMGSCVDDEA